MSENEEEQVIHPKELKKLRACFRCKLIKTEKEFNSRGCENCPQFRDYELQNYTSGNFSSMVCITNPKRSLVARFIGAQSCLPGTYALQIRGEPSQAVREQMEEEAEFNQLIMNKNKQTRRGEIFDLQTMLRRALKKTTRKELLELLKKILMYMTLGVDVTSLFADMCLLSQNEDMLAKKMVYIYLGNQAEANPKLALLVVNTFVKELTNKDVQIRGLALRSLCQLKSQFSQSKSHIIEMLNDSEPYVLKTAIFGCLKVFHEEPTFFQESGLYEIFYGLLKNPSSEVVEAVINVLNEVYEEEGGMVITGKIITYLLNRLKEFSDIGKSVVIELALKYEPKNEEEKIKIMNLLDSKIRSTHSHLVFSIIKLFLKYNKNTEIFQQVLERVKDSLLTLLITAEEELQFGLLHHVFEVIKLGGSKFFEKDYKRFFCENEDKDFVQGIKLKILQNLVTEISFDEIFNELSSYIYEANVKLASRSVIVIGQIGKQFKERIHSIVLLFMNILKAKKSYLIDEVIIALKEIYSTGVESSGKEQQNLFEEFGNFLDSIQSEKAKISVLWILARFCLQIKDSPYMLNRYVKEYSEIKEQTEEFKFQLFNSTIIIFLKLPKETMPVLSLLFHSILEKETESPLLVSKCRLYFELMQKDIKYFEKNMLQFFDQENFITEINNEEEASFSYFNSFSIIYHKPGETFTKNKQYFLNQRKQAIHDPEALNNLDIQEDEIKSEKEEKKDESEESEEEKQAIQQKPVIQKNEEIDFLNLDLDLKGENPQMDFGIVDINFEQTSKPQRKRVKKIKLTQNEIEPQQFQKHWVDWKNQKEYQVTLEISITKKEDLIEIFEGKNIYCIASKENSGQIKFYFNCQEKTTLNFFLIEIVIDSGKEFSLILKSEKESEEVGQILNLIDEILKNNKYLVQLQIINVREQVKIKRFQFFTKQF